MSVVRGIGSVWTPVARHNYIGALTVTQQAVHIGDEAHQAAVSR